MTKKLMLAICAVGVAMLLAMTAAEAIVVTFTENGWTYTGSQWQNPLAGNEFSAQGILLTNAYQYGDFRDPWDGVGIATLSDQVAVIDFIVATNSVAVDWWIDLGYTIYAEAYDVAGAPVDSFTYTSGGGVLSGTDTLTGPMIAQIHYYDTGGFPGISTLDFQPVPEPATMLMLGGLGAGLASARKLRRKK